MADKTSVTTRRGALKCLAFGGAGTLFAMAGGVFTPIDLALAGSDRQPGDDDRAVRHAKRVWLEAR